MATINTLSRTIQPYVHGFSSASNRDVWILHYIQDLNPAGTGPDTNNTFVIAVDSTGALEVTRLQQITIYPS